MVWSGILINIQLSASLIVQSQDLMQENVWMGKKNGIPIFSTTDMAMDYLNPTPEYFIYGIVPLESFLDEQQRAIFFTAMERGLHIVNGLAEYFTDDKEFVQKAKKFNVL